MLLATGVSRCGAARERLRRGAVTRVPNAASGDALGIEEARIPGDLELGIEQECPADDDSLPRLEAGKHWEKVARPRSKPRLSGTIATRRILDVDQLALTRGQDGAVGNGEHSRLR